MLSVADLTVWFGQEPDRVTAVHDAAFDVAQKVLNGGMVPIQMLNQALGAVADQVGGTLARWHELRARAARARTRPEPPPAPRRRAVRPGAAMRWPARPGAWRCRWPPGHGLLWLSSRPTLMSTACFAPP